MPTDNATLDRLVADAERYAGHGDPAGECLFECAAIITELRARIVVPPDDYYDALTAELRRQGNARGAVTVEHQAATAIDTLRVQLGTAIAQGLEQDQQLRWACEERDTLRRGYHANCALVDKALHDERHRNDILRRERDEALSWQGAYQEARKLATFTDECHQKELATITAERDDARNATDHSGWVELKERLKAANARIATIQRTLDWGHDNPFDALHEIKYALAAQPTETK